MAKGQIQDDEELELDEFDASYGDVSQVAEPVKGQTSARRGDKLGGGEKNIMQGSSKAAKVAAVVKKLGEMEADDIGDLLDAINEMEEEDDLDEGEDSIVTQDNSDLPTPGQTGRKTKKTGVEKAVKEVREVRQVTAEDIDVVDDLNALFEADDTLSAEFKEKAALIFEAAIVSKINESLLTMSTDYDADFEDRTESQLDELATKMDDYLDYCVSQWMDTNELAIEHGVRAEVAEGFLQGLKSLFDEHYIEVPEEKVDVVEQLVDNNEQLEAKLSEQIETNIELSKKVEEFERREVFEQVSEGLSDVQKDKFWSLSEGVYFHTAADYAEDITTIAENYFGGTRTVDYMIDDDDEPNDNLDMNESTVPANMSAYMKSISQTVKNR